MMKMSIYNILGTRGRGRLVLLLLTLMLQVAVVKAQIVIGGNVYGGGNAGDTDGNTNVTVREGDLNRVFGGARMANVGGHAFVHIDGEKASDYILINHVYGGNDIAGSIGKGDAVPDEIKKASANLVDKNWNAFVRITSSNTEDESVNKGKVYIGQLFGGGNGDYIHETSTVDGVTTHTLRDTKTNEIVVQTTEGGLSEPDIERTYLEIMGGSIVYAFGGGNNATVTEKTVIYVDNPSEVVNKILVDGVDQITKDNRVVEKMGLNPGYTYPSSDAFQIGSLFGGNNTAPMKIRPRWNLISGRIRNVYSGGNRGAMTSRDGLLLQIPETSSIIIDNVYGGCRMADVDPKDDNGNSITAENITEDDFGNKLNIPGGMSARTRILGGHINNVYGGNDITGNVSGGNTVGIYATVYGDIYGGGNGSYPYTDNADLKDDPTYGDLYYGDFMTEKGYSPLQSVEALNEFRPNAEQVSIYLQGKTEDKKTIIHGSIYCGGNSASLSSNKDKPKVELKVGPYVIADNVFLGNNGEHMVETHDKDAAHPNEGVLRTYGKTLAEIDPVKYAGNSNKFSTIEMTDAEKFASYMDGATMKLKPSVIFAKKNNGDPADYIDYSSYFGSFFCGGNVGSMKIPDKTTIDFSHKVVIYNKLVGGCNNANVIGSEYNAAYEGGYIGTPDSIGDKLELNLSGLKIQPKRWKEDQSDLEWNTISASSGLEVEPVTSGVYNETDKDRRLKGGNVYGGCYKSGHINGNVIINMNATVVDRKGEHAVFDQIEQEGGEAKLYENDSYDIKERVSGVILDEQGMDVLGSALNVFGGGLGKDSEIWGNVTINMNKGYTFQIFGGGEQGVIGKRLEDAEGNVRSTEATDGTINSDGTYAFNGKLYQYNPAYSCTINVKGNYAGVARDAAGDNDDMAAAEFIYGGGFEGPVCGNTIINLGNGRIFNSFAGSCNADILGHTETYVGRQPSADNTLEPGFKLGFPYVRDHIYGGNDLGGRILGSEDFSVRLSTYMKESDKQNAIYDGTHSLNAAAYTEYRQGHVENIFGGCYGDYDYTDPYFSKFTNQDGSDKAGFRKPRLHNAFVNFRPESHTSNSVARVFGAGQGHEKGVNDKIQADKMQDRSYVLIDIPSDDTRFAGLEVFGSGAQCGLGMAANVPPTTAEDLDNYKNTVDQEYSSVIDLFRGTIANVYGGSYNEGLTRRTVVNVPSVSTITVQSLFGGAYGNDPLYPCDVYESHVKYDSENATVKGNIYGGNNKADRTLYAQVNVCKPVWQDKEKGYLATVYGAGYGEDSWAQYTEVNLNPGARVYEVYGGGQNGRVINQSSLLKWQETENDLDLFMYDYKENGLDNYLVTTTALADKYGTNKKYNTNVHINEGALVEGYAYGGGLGDVDIPTSGDVLGATYIDLLGGTVNKDIYAAGTTGAVLDYYGVSSAGFTPTGDTEAVDGFIASSNAYIKGGTCRNVYGGGWQGAVGKHTYTTGSRINSKGKEERYLKYLIDESKDDDSDGEANVIIGDPDGTLFTNGIPAIERNAYGGGEGGPVFGTANITLNKGYIGYRYFDSEEDAAADYLTFANREKNVLAKPDIVPAGIADGGGYYQEKLHDETWDGDGTDRLNDSGCMFGGGYIDNSYVDVSNVTMYDGHVRNALFGGGEIAAIGRGIVDVSGEDNSVRSDPVIHKAGHTTVKLYDGYVHRNVFGGGRGYNNLGDGGTLYTDGYVFGQTEVNIYGGVVGTDEELAKGNGNVFGGGDIGYVYSAYENADGVLCRGTFLGKRYDDGDEGYYYEYENGEYLEVDGEKILTEDCKVLVEPWCKVKTTAVTFDGTTYDVGEYVPTAYLNTLGNKNAPEWANLYDDGIIIRNAVFAGGNTSSGSSKVYANATSIFGNATASIHDVYHRDLITVGTGHVGGLYGDGNLTFVDGYRGLNITNYGTDYYTISKEIDIDAYHELPEREAAYYELRYKCIKDCTDKDGTAYYAKSNAHPQASTISADDLITLFEGINGDNDQPMVDASGKPQEAYWEENGVCSRYAGRPMNTIQRADFCGVFGSRMVMQGARDRVPEAADFTNYTINRVREVSLNKKESVISGDAGTGEAYHGNYFGIYNIVNYLGALTSDVDFNETVRTTDASDATKYKTPANGKAYGDATYADWKKQYKEDRRRNNGSSHNQVALASGVYLELTSEESTGNDLYEKDWGLITGVIELDLINVQTGIGGGFVYARNEHGNRTDLNLSHVTLTKLNTGAVTNRNFSYDTDDPDKEEWQTSGNFVHSTQTIIDDCYNISGKYKTNYKAPDGVPAHYWYVKGDIYVYDQEISAYTGAPNAYSETVEIPLTITAASHGKMKLLNVQPNWYAYYSSPGVKLKTENKVIINDVEYHLNDPISYWDYYLLSASEKALFVPKTYVTIADCKIGETEYPEGYVMLPDEYNTLRDNAPTKDIEDDDTDASVPSVYDTTKEKDVAFDYVFRPSNNLSHDTGYMLTYKVNNPTEWNTWYTQYASATAAKQQSAADDYNSGPTFHLSGTGGLLGQRDYDESNIISKEVYDTYQAAKTNHAAAIPATGQAEFEPAYMITEAVSITETVNGTTSTRHLNEDAIVSESYRTNHSLSSKTTPAYVCISTIQLSATEFIYLNSKMSEIERNGYVTRVTNDIKTILPTLTDEQIDGLTKLSDLDRLSEPPSLSNEQTKSLASLLALREEMKAYIVPAYYCTKEGKYGGNYYEGDRNYRGLEVFSSMSKDDRNQFTFNYDAFDLLIDPTYGGTAGQKYQYDSSAATEAAAEANRTGYSLEKPVDYTATYTGSKTDTYNGITLANGREYTRTEFEQLPNEKRHYSGIVVNTPGDYYVVKTSFQVGNTPYAIGATIPSSTYNTLGTSERECVTTLTFTQEQIEANKEEGAVRPFYYCREPYEISNSTGGTAVTGMVVTGATVTGSYSSNGNKNVPIGLVIDATTYKGLVNAQTDFTIHGIAPTEVSTLYVSRESDIFNLSTEKIITVIYQYDYEESDTYGNITPQSERHVVNIHLKFKSGVPFVEDIKVPQVILPGDNVSLREPDVTPGAYEVTGGGWEIFETIEDAESHTNGIDYLPSSDPLYWYQNGYYVAYYAKTYLGKTYSNHVPLSVANYHDLAAVMSAGHHYYVDNPSVKRDSKIYINDYSSISKNGLDLLKDMYDRSLDGTLNSHVSGLNHLDFILRADIGHSGTWESIGGTTCFSGTFHGDGYTITGLDHSLFDKLCGSVYNLGVMGSFTEAGVANSGDGYVESCWVKSSAESTSEVTRPYPVLGDPSASSDYQVVNCYYPESNKVLYNTGTHARGTATPMPDKAFYNGEVAYDLNNFYLYKRYSDQKTTSGLAYQYYKRDGSALKMDNEGQSEVQNGYYADNAALCSSGYRNIMYVEERFDDGDYRYAGGTIPESQDERYWKQTVTVIEGDKTTTKNVDRYLPIWPDDYIFFGQRLTYGHDELSAHQDNPTTINRSGNRLQTGDNSNRVYRAPAYFRSKEMSVAHFNPNAIFSATKKDDDQTLAYKGMTAIDFTGFNDGDYQLGNSSVGGTGSSLKGFYPPLLDDDGLTGFRNIDLTQNLLVYSGTETTAMTTTNTVVSNYLADPTFSETSTAYHTVAIAPTNGIKGHLVEKTEGAFTTSRDHLLVDKQDFNCPIAYTMGSGQRMWYQRTPDRFVNQEKGWDIVSLPFTSELVTTQDKGEITHFYRGSTTGHEYWLREYNGIDANATVPAGELAAKFTYPSATETRDKTDGNTFLWDYYYSKDSYWDKNVDEYQKTYYNSPRQYDGYPLAHAATPYLIGFPGETYYEFDLSGNWTPENRINSGVILSKGRQTISFVSKEGVQIGISDNENGTTQDGYTFRANYLNDPEIGAGKTAYLLDTDGDSFDKTETVATGAISAFRPYFVNPADASGGTRGKDVTRQPDKTQRIIFSGEIPSLGNATAIRDLGVGEDLIVKGGKKKIAVESQLRYTADVRIVTPAGITLKTFTIQPTEYVETRVETAGVYIVEGDEGRYVKKVIVR
ncbi:MAG: hypothetical protein IJ067_06190 [Prevotella sp.]|nr:hypothetical protein [Prevotella sp.]